VGGQKRCQNAVPVRFDTKGPGLNYTCTYITDENLLWVRFSRFLIEFGTIFIHFRLL